MSRYKDVIRNKEDIDKLVKLCPCFATSDFGPEVKPEWNRCIVPCNSQLEYLEKREEIMKPIRHRLLTEMVREAEEMGLYDEEE